MGVLYEVASGRRWALPARALLGRAATCAIVLDAPMVSGEHAVLAWGDDGWELRDLGSTNGTWIGGRRLDAGRRAVVRAGDAIGAGSAEPDVLLVDDSGPGAVACGPDGAMFTAQSGLVALPHGDVPALLHQDLDGAWLVDVDGVASPVGDGGEVLLGGQTWRFLIPAGVPLDLAPTMRRLPATVPAPSGLTLCFQVSRDEETVGLRLRWDAGDLPLPDRAFHYLLLTLARARLADQAAGVSRAEQGWIPAERLERMMGYGRERVNVEIHRARTLFAEVGVPQAATLVARRAMRREVRLEVAGVVVTREE